MFGNGRATVLQVIQASRLFHIPSIRSSGLTVIIAYYVVVHGQRASHCCELLLGIFSDAIFELHLLEYDWRAIYKDE